MLTSGPSSPPTEGPNLQTSSLEAASDDLAVRYAPCDELLLSRVCKGDEEALALLFRRYARVVRGVALRIVKDPSEADDLVQDIFL